MKISIFIPTYNSGEILKETLDSVLGQTHQDLEILCVDDSSTDNGLTWGILNEYATKDSSALISKAKSGLCPLLMELYSSEDLRRVYILYVT